MSASSDHRQFIRHPVGIPLEVCPEGEAPAEMHLLQNVSLGGLAFAVAHPLEPGRIIGIRLPDTHPPFEAKGKIVWCRKQEQGFEVGMQFIDAEEAFRARMVEQVCHIEQYRNEVQQKEGRVLSGNEAAQEWIARNAQGFPSVSAPPPLRSAHAR